MALTRDAIKAINDTRYKTIHVKAWNEDIRIKTLTAKEQLEIANVVNKPNGGLESVIKMVMLSCVDENDEVIFVAGDEDWLQEKHFSALVEISEAATELNDLSKEAVEEKAKP